MFALREAHERGATRVSSSGAHVLTGGQDGVVTLFPAKRWPQGKPIWARQCHAAAVTYVILQDDLQLAFSCGRDGHVFLHENIHDTTGASTSRLICRVTGEIRCMFFDVGRKRLLLGGDSLRCLKMSGSRFEVQMVPLVVPYPIAAVSVSPCGKLLAMASTKGNVGVVSLEGSGADNTTPATRLVLDKVSLSAAAGKDDQCTYRLQWCRTAGGLFLFVPTAAAVAVVQLITPDGPAGTAGLKQVAMLYGEGLTDLCAVCAYPTTPRRVCCIMASRSGGIFIGKADDSKFRMSRLTSQQYDAVEHGTLTDLQVNEATGDVVVGLSTGRVSLLHRAAPKAYNEAKEAKKKAAHDEKKLSDQPLSGAEKLLGVETQPSRSDADESEESSGEGNASAKLSREERRGNRRPRKHRTVADENEDDFINDEASDSGSDGGSNNEDASSSSSSSDASSDTDSDLDENGNVQVHEDLKKVVVDLKANNADYVEGDDVERPSRWRDDDPRRVLADAECEARRHKENTSRFLDDEAEEASSTDVEDEDAAAYEEDGYGERRRRRDADRKNEEDEEDEAEEGFYAGEGNSVAGTNAGGDTAFPASGSATAALGVPAMLDYSFQVGATPAGEDESCYLAYNSTGFIRCTRDGTTVHFHDVSNPAVRINEKGTIIMGALSPIGAGFVVAPQSRFPGEEGGGGSGMAAPYGDSVDEAEEEPRLMVYFRTFVALGAQSDWRARLQPGETVRCMAAGGRFLAVATSRYLRLYSLSGLELAVLSKFPRIVAMAGTSSRKLLNGYKASFDPLAVVYLEGGEHKMEVMDVGSRSMGIHAQVLPLTEMADGSSHQLQWIGWSEDGPLHVADTAGVVRMYTQSWGGAWVPVFDPRALSDQSYNLWIWGANDECLFAYKSTKTDPAYPAAVVSGLPVERVPLFLPLTRTAATAVGGGADRETTAWDHILRREIRTDELKRHSNFYSAAIAKHDAVHDTKIKELFQNALRAQQTSRAMDLAMMLELRDNLEDCARDANSGGHTQLVQKLLTLYDMRLKSKLKRKCELPLEKAMVSEKERDELLRRLLVRERNGGKVTNSSSGGKKEEEVVAETEALVEAKAASLSPAKSEAMTTVTATTDRSPPALKAPAESPGPHATARRHVTFNVPEATPPPPSKSLPTPVKGPTPCLTPTPTPTPGKATNPFATKRNPAAVGSVLPAAPRTGIATEQTQTPTPPRPARTTFTTIAPAAPSVPTVDVIGGDSQQPSPVPVEEESVADTHTPEKTPALQPTASALAEVIEEEGARCSPARDGGGDSTSGGGRHHADSLSPSGGRATDTTPAAVKKPTFIPRALPARGDDTRDTQPPQSRTPVDPFLADSPLSFTDSLHDGPGVVSVDALLDVGHEDSLPSAPRSSGFGEALRKRYREDDEGEDSNEMIVPATSFARVS